MEMEMNHPTSTPKQAQTDTMAVFADDTDGFSFDSHDDLVLVRRVEVPRYTAPHADAPELDRGTRFRLAVLFAVSSEDSLTTHREAREMEFYVMDDVKESMSLVDGCPSAMEGEIPAGVWNPNEQALEDEA